jgi:hypothetical protein
MRTLRVCLSGFALSAAVAVFTIAGSTGSSAQISICNMMWQPVCGIAKDGKKRTWANVCWATKDGATKVHPGACK